MSSAARRVQLEPGFLLHHYPWRDSSLILEFLTRAHGRISVFARAARRGGSTLPATLQPFGELLVSWSARGEAGQLTGAERVQSTAFLAGDLLSGHPGMPKVMVPRHSSETRSPLRPRVRMRMDVERYTGASGPGRDRK